MTEKLDRCNICHAWVPPTEITYQDITVKYCLDCDIYRVQQELETLQYRLNYLTTTRLIRDGLKHDENINKPPKL